MSTSPNLDFYRRRAKELLQRIRAADPDVWQRLAQHHPQAHELRNAPDRVALHDAQLVIAREQGFSSWTRFKAYVDVMTRTAPKSPEEHLYAIVRAADLDALDAFLETHPDAMRLRIAPLGFTVIHLAVQHGWTAGVERLLAAGADINVLTDEVAMTPLLVALGYEQPALARMLLERGADPSVGALPDRTTLQWSGRYPDIVRTLLDRGVPMDIFTAVALEDAPAIHALVQRDADVLRQRMRPFQAVTMTPLHAAAHGNAAEIVDLLVALGAPRDEPDEQGRTPIDLALHAGKRQAYERLRAHGALVNPELLALVQTAERSERIAKLHQAILDGDATRIVTELDADPSLVNQHFPDVWGSGGTFGAAPLHWAAMSGRVPIAQLLIARGADPSLRDLTYGGTPRGWAQQYQQREMFAFLEAQSTRQS